MVISINKDRKFILSLIKGSQVCIYNSKPNKVTEKTLTKLLDFFSTEFHVIEKVRVVDSFDGCHLDTRLYVFLHEGNLQKSELHDAVMNIVKRHDLNYTKESSAVNSMAYSLGFLKEGRIVSFVSINQMSASIDHSTVSKNLQSMIIQEIFQAITQGRDIEDVKYPRSILEESDDNHGQTHKVNIEAFNKYLINNPTGMCGYDVWYLLLKYNYTDNRIFYSDFKINFNKKYREIKKRAQKIEKNPTYKDLFDPRCSGKNTGVNTKIGIQ